MMVSWPKQNWPRLLIHAAGIGPLLMMTAYYVSEALVNPIRYVILRSGMIGLIFLIASFACVSP